MSQAPISNTFNNQENIMQNNTGFIKTHKTREQVYQGPKGKAERHAWKRNDKRKAYE